MFIYSLPIFFTHTGLASPVELLIIIMAIFSVLFVSSPLCEGNWQEQPVTNYLLDSWIGKVSLKWAFWPFFLILNGCLYATDTLARTGIFTVSSWDDVHFILLLPIIWWATAVWRCTANSNSRLWGVFARLMIFGVFFEYGIKLFIRIEYPRVFFNCQDLLLDYGSCF
ncbi:MAG: hypothetical protein ACXWTT_03625 [Methylobacter sp.]